MLPARVASAWILPISITARGAAVDEGPGVATWLPESSSGEVEGAAVATVDSHSTEFVYFIEKQRLGKFQRHLSEASKAERCFHDR